MLKTDKWESSLNLFQQTLFFWVHIICQPGKAGLCLYFALDAIRKQLCHYLYLDPLQLCLSMPALNLKPVPSYVFDLSDGRVSDVPSCLTYYRPLVRPLIEFHSGFSSGGVPLESLNIFHFAGIYWLVTFSHTFFFS